MAICTNSFTVYQSTNMSFLFTASKSLPGERYECPLLWANSNLLFLIFLFGLRPGGSLKPGYLCFGLGKYQKICENVSHSLEFCCQYRGEWRNKLLQGLPALLPHSKCKTLRSKTWCREYWERTLHVFSGKVFSIVVWRVKINSARSLLKQQLQNYHPKMCPWLPSFFSKM